MARPVRRVVPFPSDDLMPMSDTEVKQLVNVYLPLTLAEAV